MDFEAIRKHPDLGLIVREKCEENGVCVDFDPKILPNDYLILKVDDYYNTLNIPKRPASPDCMIILSCESGGHKLVLVELKNISNTAAFEINNLVEKFQTCLNDFIGTRFKDILDYDYLGLDLFFVSNIELYKRDISLGMQMLMRKKIQYKGKSCLIEPRMPTPLIRPCYNRVRKNMDTMSENV